MGADWKWDGDRGERRLPDRVLRVDNDAGEWWWSIHVPWMTIGKSITPSDTRESTVEAVEKAAGVYETTDSLVAEAAQGISRERDEARAQTLVLDPPQTGLQAAVERPSAERVAAEAKLAAAQAALLSAKVALCSAGCPRYHRYAEVHDHVADALANGTAALDAVKAQAREEGHAAGMTEMRRHIEKLIADTPVETLREQARREAYEEGATAMRGAAVALSVTTRLRPDRPQERIAPSDVLTVAREAVAAYRDAIAALPTVAR